jgi:CubicO group peptidase (beta-lactamase class C family)
LDSLATSFLKEYNIKGIAMVGVKNNEIVFNKGFGKANESFAMTPETPLYIASNTKAFVGLAMADLIEKGKLHLNDPITNYIDRNYFPQSIEVGKITINDILAHNTGLSNDPITFRTSSSGEYPKNLQELLKFTIYRNDAKNLKKEFSYSNFGYLLCGIIIQNVTGKTWKQYLVDNVLIPLNLLNTEPYLPKGKKREAMAMPYVFTKKEPLKMVKQDNTLHAAGGLITNLNDMATWLTYFTGTDTRSKAFKTEHKNYLASQIDDNENFGPIKITGYGYGWYHGDFFGTPILFHTGGFSGHNSFISYLPNEKAGCFIYVNESTNLRLVALQLAFYYYSMLSDNDNFLKSMAIFTKKTQAVYNTYKSDELIPIKPQNQALPIGTFKNDQYGTLKISKDNDHYIISLGNNLYSKAYVSDDKSGFKVQFIPEHTVNFSVIEKGNGLKIKYGNYGYFLPIEID